MGLLSKNDLLQKYEKERVKTDNYTRVMGYLRPFRLVIRWDGHEEVTSSFNTGKLGEVKERVWFKTQKSLEKFNSK